MVTRHSVLALTLLFVLSAISGCKPEAEKTLNMTRYLTPAIYIQEGQVLKLRPSRGDVVTLTFEKGLCKESGPVRSTFDQPAGCTIAQQTFDGDKPKTYTVTVSRPDGSADPPYEVDVVQKMTKPCTGFC
jgi:hypothetical protein